MSRSVAIYDRRAEDPWSVLFPAVPFWHAARSDQTAALRAAAGESAAAAAGAVPGHVVRSQYWPAPLCGKLAGPLDTRLIKTERRRPTGPDGRRPLQPRLNVTRHATQTGRRRRTETRDRQRQRRGTDGDRAAGQTETETRDTRRQRHGTDGDRDTGQTETDAGHTETETEPRGRRRQRHGTDEDRRGTHGD